MITITKQYNFTYEWIHVDHGDYTILRVHNEFNKWITDLCIECTSHASTLQYASDDGIVTIPIDSRQFEELDDEGIVKVIIDAIEFNGGRPYESK